MRVFVLEDDPDRIRLLSANLLDDDWTCIHTCEREYEFKPPYDLILLDHDLGGRQLEDHEDCGLTFVRMVKDRINPDAYIIIHSFNSDGARAMEKELEDFTVTREPFGSADFNKTIIALRNWIRIHHGQG